LSRKATPEDFKAVHEPGFALAATNFLVEEAGPGTTIVTTETRIYATDAWARRRFAVYWRTIYPGSSLLRYTWLRAIRRRAESAGS
jgi:tRNA U34 5-methylaminomethyl-2-thiouridine-forming methyltransferase MnmC